MVDDDSHEVADGQQQPNGTVQKNTFVIADDHPPVIMAVGLMVAQAVGSSSPPPTIFTRSDELLAACALPSPVRRIVITDLVMPGKLKRVALVQALHAAAPDARILVYTADESAFLAQAVLDAGALGFVAKTSLATELLAALRAMLDGQRYVDRNVFLDGVEDHPWRSLTDSEREILLAFARGLSTKEIAATTGRRDSTVFAHKYNGIKKLALRDIRDILSYLHVHGLVHELDNDPTYERPSS